jgi:hypothetical protein
MMKGNKNMKTKTNIIYLALALFAFACFALSPQARAICQNGCDTGNSNTFLGDDALINNTTGVANTAIGSNALISNTTGYFNTANGTFALYSNTGGYWNTANGGNALENNTTGNDNTATGVTALVSNTTGDGNTAVGASALSHNMTGSHNTAMGEDALIGNTINNNSTAVGWRALFNVTGDRNIGLGREAGLHVGMANNVICIGIQGDTVSNSCFIGNIRDVTTAQNDAVPVLIDSKGQLGTASSSRRFKREIQPMNKASEAILALKPVTFHYQSDKTNRPEFGLIAEEVAEVNPDLVVRDENGEIYTVRYDAVNAMLLNEFLKAYRKMEEQGATIAKQQKQIDALTRGLQKVSDQLEMNRPAPQTVLNNQ